MCTFSIIIAGAMPLQSKISFSPKSVLVCHLPNMNLNDTFVRNDECFVYLTGFLFRILHYVGSITYQRNRTGSIVYEDSGENLLLKILHPCVRIVQLFSAAVHILIFYANNYFISF